MIGRLALRAAVINALTNGGQPPFPTIAANGVFDTKLTPVEHQISESQLPIILVYTDKDTHGVLNSGDGWGFTQRDITLMIELAVGKFQRMEYTDPHTKETLDLYKLDYVQTDDEMEAVLDILEWQVWLALHNPYNPHSVALRKLVRRWNTWESTPARLGEQANSLAMRLIEAVVTINPDCLPRAAAVGPGQTHKPTSVDSYIDIPWLAALEQIIVENPSFETLREQLREAKTGVPGTTVPTLTRLGVYTDAIDPEADPNRLPAGTTTGPDGRIEYEQQIDLTQTD